MSIRFRLTLIYNAILAATLIIFGVALYSIQSQSTLRSIKSELRVSSDNLNKSLFNSPSGTLSTSPNSSKPESQTNPPDISDSLPTVSQKDQNPPPPVDFGTFSGDPSLNHLREREIVRVLDPSGNLVVSPFGTSDTALPLSEEGLAALQNNQEWWQTEEVDTQELLILNRPITKDGEVTYILQVARPLNERLSSLKDLRNTLFVASLIAVVLAFGIGWIIAGITIKPIHRITQTAQSIGNEHDFSKRVSYKGPQDEVGTLATTFNSMLSQLENAFKKISRSLEMQQNFVADVSHELRTPLTTLRGNLGLLRRNPPIPQEEQKDILNDMVDESDRMIRLVNNLLELASADSGRNLKKAPLSLSSFLEELYHQAIQMGDERKIILQTSDDVTIQADKDALKQVLLIGIDNALKHTQGDILIGSSVTGNHVEIYISDQGAYISQENQQHIFDRFYRGEEPAIPGFGLGLPIAKALIEGMGGEIAFVSEENKGGRLTITLD